MMTTAVGAPAQARRTAVLVGSDRTTACEDLAFETGGGVRAKSFAGTISCLGAWLVC